MLQKRENELRSRREHVEKLLKWHQRLDVEEREVIKMEQMIMFISTSDAYQTTSHEQINDTVAITVHHHSKRTNCQRNEDSSVHERSLTNVTETVTAMEKTRFEHKKQKQIYKIEKSLNTLKMISSQSISSDIDGSIVDDTVEVYGRQLNKLWKRLTGQHEEKFSPDKMYSLGKTDLELMYEQAKSVVLKQFHANEEFKRRLIDNSVSIIETSHANDATTQKPIEQPEKQTNVEKQSDNEAIVPTLNLTNFSPEPKENIISDTDQGYYFENSNIEQIGTEHHQQEQQQEQPTKQETQSIETATLDAMSENLLSSQVSSEEQIQEEVEDDDETASLPEDVQSDITEDSLNKPKSSSVENVYNTSEIQTVSNVNEPQTDETGKTVDIPSAIELSQPSLQFNLNLSNNNVQLIEETSFPNIDIQTTISTVADSDISSMSISPVKNSTFNANSQPSDEQKYRSDEFEEAKSADELTSISTATVTKIATTPTVTTPTVTASTTNQSTEKSVATNIESSKELEHRLVSIGDALKEISRTLSKSPVLQSDSDGKMGSDSEKSQGTKTPSSDSEIKYDTEIKTAESTAKTEENSQANSAKSTESDETSTESKSSTSENVVDIQKMDSDESTDSIAAEIAASKIDKQNSNESQPQKRQYQYTLSASSIDYNKVPEADALKRSQIPLETEVCLKMIKYFCFENRHLI